MTRTTCRLAIDRLPDRINPVVTDMTAMAGYFPTHDGPTTLWINFDGCTNLGGTDTKPGHTVAPFTGTAADKADILYRVSEEFAPFNVAVKQDYGFGNYQDSDGATTVFVGDDRYFDQAVPSLDGTPPRLLNQNGGATPNGFWDIPASNKPKHAPNSDPFDLAFADPVGQAAAGSPAVNQDNEATAEAIAHEAGHTFGLAHVLSQPTTDLMSYDAQTRFFADRAFPITALNFTPAGGSQTDSTLQPVFTDPADGKQANITTQDSFTYLGATLGYRPAHQPRVSHLTSVDSSAYANFSANYGVSFTRDVDLGAGDYRVYHIVPGDNVTKVDVKIDRTAGAITPMALVYPADGGVQFFESRLVGSGQLEVQARLTFGAGRPFDLVVGGIGGSDGGRLHVQVSRPLDSFPVTSLLTSVIGSVAPAFGPGSYVTIPAGILGGFGSSTGSFGSGSSTLDARVQESSVPYANPTVLPPKPTMSVSPDQTLMTSFVSVDVVSTTMVETVGR